MGFPTRFRLASTVAFLFAAAVSSCAAPRESAVPAYSLSGERQALLVPNEEGVSGELVLGGKTELRFSLSRPLAIPPGSAIELEYRIDGAETAVPVFTAPGETAWALPGDLSFLGVPGDGRSVMRYRFPARSAALAGFRIESRAAGAAAEQAPQKGVDSGARFKLIAVRIAPRAYGYAAAPDAHFASPYVYRESEGAETRIVVDPPASDRPTGPAFVHLMLGSASGRILSGATTFGYAGVPAAETPFSVLMFPGALPPEPFPVVYSSAQPPAALTVGAAAAPAFPSEPIPADPGLVLAYRREAWRDSRYEVFRWERFPSILVFDTADYAVQDRLFKRLAFFVEKAGFRGTLAADADIAALHGWNAHDYRASDLALFFETARKTAFALNAEERELREILIAAGIVRVEGTGEIQEGKGAIISISRESEDYLRSLFMTHEGYHGLFFTDADFRAYADGRWKNLEPESKRFLKAYFDSRRYDVNDAFLMTNELMAYALQQPVSLAGRYFGELIPSRVEKDLRRSTAILPRTEGELGWPSYAAEFTRIAKEYDAYVRSRWGLRAGAVATVYQISRTNAAR